MPSGKSTTGVLIFCVFFVVVSTQEGTSAWVSEFIGHPVTTFIGGNRSAKALIAVDFPVPLSPNTSTPPIFGSMAVRTSANFILSWPTIAVNGKGVFIYIFPDYLVCQEQANILQFSLRENGRIVLL